MTSALTVETVARPDGAVVVSLIGPGDVAGAEVLERQLTLLCAKKPPHVVFDLTRLTFISSLCMGQLIHLRRGCDGWGGKLTLARANDLVVAALRRARLDTILRLAPSVESAFAADRSTAPA